MPRNPGLRYWMEQKARLKADGRWRHYIVTRAKLWLSGWPQSVQTSTILADFYPPDSKAVPTDAQLIELGWNGKEPTKEQVSGTAPEIALNTEKERAKRGEPQIPIPVADADLERVLRMPFERGDVTPPPAQRPHDPHTKQRRAARSKSFPTPLKPQPVPEAPPMPMPPAFDFTDALVQKPEPAMFEFDVPEVPQPAAPTRNQLGVSDARSWNDVIRWVFDNMGNEKIAAADAPTPGAFAMLVECQRNPMARKDFYNGPVKQLITKENDPEADRAHDTGYDNARDALQAVLAGGQ